MSGWRAWLARARRELAEKPRLRLGAWAIAALLLVNILLLQAERLTAARAAYADEAARASVVSRALLRRGDWPQLLETARANAALLEQRLWRADSAGHAQAQLQQALTALLAAQGFASPRVQPGLRQPVAAAPGVFRVQARLSGRYEGAGALALLLAIAEREPQLVVDRLVMQRSGRSFSLLVSAYFTGFDAEAAPTEAAG